MIKEVHDVHMYFSLSKDSLNPLLLGRNPVKLDRRLVFCKEFNFLFLFLGHLLSYRPVQLLTESVMKNEDKNAQFLQNVEK